jgi:hypothetical protein
MLKYLRTMFPRSVRASLYAAAVAADAALIADGQLPAWSAAVVAPMLLALLHLTPKDVDQAPGQD